MDKKTKDNLLKLVVVVVMLSVIVFSYKWYGGVDKTVEGQLVQVKIFTRFDGRSDTVVVFNVSGENKYVVINEWKTGQVVELSSHTGKMIRLSYMFLELQDRNVLKDYELI